MSQSVTTITEAEDTDRGIPSSGESDHRANRKWAKKRTDVPHGTPAVETEESPAGP